MFVSLRRVYFPERLATRFVVSHASLAGPGPGLASCHTVDRYVNKQREWLIAGRRGCSEWQVQLLTAGRGDADDGENRGVGLKRRKEGAQPALFVLARTQAFITPPEIQSKALFTHSAFGIRASCKSFSLSFFLSLYLFLCLAHIQGVCWNFSSDGWLLLRGKERRPGHGSLHDLRLPSLYTSFPLSSFLSSKAFFTRHISFCIHHRFYSHSQSGPWDSKVVCKWLRSQNWRKKRKMT